MAQNIVYYGIFIDKESKNKLKSLVPRTAYKVYCDHMTLAHSSTFTDDVVNTCNGLLGKEFTITATTIGKSKDAMAVGIETDCFSVNNHKHITLCTMTPSSKPVQSNYIENWAKLKKPIILKGTVMAFTNNGLIKENKIMEKKLIRLTESDLHRIVKESVKRILSEIGDTPRGNFALNAVKGRRAAKGYRTNMGIKDRAENSKMIGRADDEAWKGYKDSLNTPNPLRSHNNEAGYNYGFQKGVEKYQK